ncbi:hypothetical protein BRADI_1g52975v3 [Brachypodium distachyon]|uniref:Uncharacterized protein n=1 Tax=Brachypodium distachyon TaxID=15368 RepID=A0A0Q3K6K2_BRADI|nr:hypothetical protein BRADI_1g52975v3 [Brachypodium distachyon]
MAQSNLCATRTPASSPAPAPYLPRHRISIPFWPLSFPPPPVSLAAGAPPPPSSPAAGAPPPPPPQPPTSPATGGLGSGSPWPAAAFAPVLDSLRPTPTTPWLDLPLSQPLLLLDGNPLLGVGDAMAARRTFGAAAPAAQLLLFYVLCWQPMAQRGRSLAAKATAAIPLQLDATAPLELNGHCRAI